MLHRSIVNSHRFEHLPPGQARTSLAVLARRLPDIVACEKMLALKRPRDSPSSCASQPTECSPHRQMMLLESPASKRNRAHSADPTPACSAFPCEKDAGSSSSQQLFNLSSTLRQRVDPVTGEVLFTMEQVRDIVRKAVDEKERNLREQYDRILQQKLQEQYQSFAKFTEDYVSRSLKSSDLGYVS